MQAWDDLFQSLRLMVQEQPAASLRLGLVESRAWPDQRLQEPVVPQGERGPAEAVHLALPGLYGHFGVLPDYFTDELLREGHDRDAMRAFLDMFNHRLLEMLVRIWSRYRLFLEDPLEPGSPPAERTAHYLDRIGGKLGDAAERREERRFIRGLRWSAAPLYRRSVRTAAGLLDLLRGFFPGLQIELTTFVARYRAIPDTQFAKLGVNIALGSQGNFLAGRTIKDIGGAFRLTFRDLDYATFMRLSPGGEWRTLLRALVLDYARGQLECLVRLELNPEDVPAMAMGKARLGLDTWALSGPPDHPEVVDTGVLA